MKTRSRNLVLLATLAGVVWPWLALAQTNAPATSADRFLLILDTSAAMRRRATGVRQAVESLLNTSMGAELERGDTLGIWTFSDELQAGRFPLQTWTPDTSEQVASNILNFVRAQTNAGASRYEMVHPVLQRVIQESPRLTVLLFSDGDEPISGTPFDWQIERALASKYRQQQRARMPFITVLRSVRGQVVSATVNMAPWPVEFPKFPPEPKLVEQPKPKPEPNPQTPPRPTLPPLIIIGNKKQDPSVLTNAAAKAVTNAPPTNGVAMPVLVPTPNPITNLVLHSTNGLAATNLTLPASVTKVASYPPPAKPVSAAVTNPPPLVVAASPAQKTNSAPVKSVSDPQIRELASTTAPPTAVTTSIQTAVSAPAQPGPPKQPPEPRRQTNAIQTATAPSATNRIVSPIQKSAPSGGEKLSTIVAATTVAPAVTVPATPAHATNSIELAVTAPPGASSGSTQWLYLLGGLVTIALGVGVFLRLQRRARPAESSLISRSLDQKRK